MAVKRILFFLANLVLLNAQLCTQVPGRLKQIDAGNGFVTGLDPTGDVYLHFAEDNWLYLAGNMKHVSAGSGGIWMIDNNDYIYRLINGKVEKVPGSLSQIDAGGSLFVYGVNLHNMIYCLSTSGLTTMKAGSPVPWTNMDGRLIYSSCGLRGCWGVNSLNQVWFRHGVLPNSCQGTHWENVPGTFSMIEIGNDGSVYAVNTAGIVYRRDGITDNTAVGTTWTEVGGINARVKHLSYDLNTLWLITQDNKALRCQL